MFKVQKLRTGALKRGSSWFLSLWFAGRFLEGTGLDWLWSLFLQAFHNLPASELASF
jgi:hypothetical protein